MYCIVQMCILRYIIVMNGTEGECRINYFHVFDRLKVNALEDYPHEQQKYIAIPVDQDGLYSTCDMYKRDYSNYTTDELWEWNTTLMTNNDTETVVCNAWVYDQSEFVSTSMSRVCT